MAKRKDYSQFIGQRFGMLVLNSLEHFEESPKIRASCTCDCGVTRIFKTISRIVSGRTKSCGCKRMGAMHQAIRKHGHATGNKSGAYSSWRAMNSRCNYIFNKYYSNYGGRGIKVCERWCGRDGFINFLSDMGERPEGFSLDRIDSDGPYSPDNCKWSNRSEQNKNRKFRKKEPEPWL